MKNKNILIDTGFWIAYFDKKDQHHLQAMKIANNIFKYHLLLPWPTLYEFINSKFLKFPIRINNFSEIINTRDVSYLDDSEFRIKALSDIQKNISYQRRKFSLVDIVIREILQSTEYKIDILVTYNIQDFEDICRLRKIEIIN